MNLDFSHQFLQTSVAYLKGIGPKRAEIFEKEFNIKTYADLLQYFPFRYVDKSVVYQIKDITDFTQYIQLKGTIKHIEMVGEKKGKRLVAELYDDTGMIELVWFKGADWILKTLKKGGEYVVFGKPTIFNHSYNIPHPEIEIIGTATESSSKGLEPVYSLTEKAKRSYIDNKVIAKAAKLLVDLLTEKNLPEIFSDELIKKYSLYNRKNAYTAIHYPKDEQELAKAIYRIKFEELFFIQLRIMKLKFKQNKTIRGFVFEKIDKHFNTFYQEKMPFELTNAQKRVLREIRRDTLSGKQMNRLLQGDVGSGKTIVALLTALMAMDNGFQASIMAPTEILAQQHFESISQLVKGMGIEVALLTGSVKGKTRKYILENLKEGNIHLLIGTHALIEQEVLFQNLGMVIIDEQHRFGVAQRAKLWQKNHQPPHVLVMTATPIPRTLAMTVYGDLDVSIIDELPPNRKSIKTLHKTDADRLRLFGFVKEQITLGRQVYFVYPMIEDSEEMDLKSLMDGYESISRAFPLPEYKVSILYGKMKSENKDYEMQRFLRGETQLMVATTVIEVGVNVPNASVMVIENAERFGLSQLHQLRGRVGRGAEQSFCILMTGKKLSNDSKRRVEVMCQTNDGFIIAEEDLKLRGPGDLDGTKQSGNINLRLANIAEDLPIMENARNAAFDLINTDPELNEPNHQALKSYLRFATKDNLWSNIS